MREITPLLQIRQVAQLRRTTCNLQGLSPTRTKEHTNNLVQRPHFRGQGTKKKTPKDQQALRSRNSSPAREYSRERKPKVAVVPQCLRTIRPIGDGRRRKEEALISFSSTAQVSAVSWKVKLSPTVCLSTQEAEYYALSEGTKEALNLRMLLRGLGFGQPEPTYLYCDTKGAITMSIHPANKPATRHVDMRIHFCRQHTELGDVAPLFVPTPDMVTDCLTKQTPRPVHERHSLRIFGSQDAPVPLTVIRHLMD
jgi:hypothetical protein